MRLQMVGLGIVGVLSACQNSAKPPEVPPGQPTPVAGQLCPAWVHDRYQAKGPDGEHYPTWHPQVDPNFNCFFDHEHGDDPTTSLANGSLPPFGYIGKAAGMDEAHAGFKVFVANRGSLNDEGRTALTSSRIVVHMGTGGVKRYSERHHSLIYDLVAPDGHEVHVQGMADTGMAGSICERDQSLQDADPSNDIGRTVMTLPGPCHPANPGSLYEIWAFSLRLVGKLEVNVSTAAFDPITTMNPADKSALVLTSTAFPQFTANYGCNREAYHGGPYWYNKTGPRTFTTDAFGNPGTALQQVVSNHGDLGIPMARRADGDLGQFKLHRPTCGAGLGLKN